jgi:cation diffusion facilitator CzcD-associated flavoprotein CzcO
MTDLNRNPDGLAQLQARLKQDLAWLDLPAKDWVIARSFNGQPVIDVAIIGAGMAGMAAAASLRMLGIHAVLFDRAPVGHEGPWATTARMETLRSPKQLTGPALGLPALTFRAWFEAQYGIQAWEVLDKIPRLQWMDYLRWYRKVLELDVRNVHEVRDVIACQDGHVEIHLDSPAGPQIIHARRLVIASGRDGLGGPYVPDFALSLPRHLWAHSSDAIDAQKFNGKRIGVIGAGASAMDSAATALEAGAQSVDLLIRRSDMPRINKGKGAGNAGLTLGHVDLPDEWKWRIRHYINSQQVPAPRGSTLRVSKFKNARFNFACPIQEIEAKNDLIHITTPRALFTFDFLILSTGFRINWQARPEYAHLAPYVRAWKDRYQPHAAEHDQELMDSPDLGPIFQLQEKIPGSCPGLESIHCFCYPAALSHGTVSGDIPAISDGAKRLAQGIASAFYREDVAQHFERIQQFDEPELLGNEWIAAN